MAESSLSTCPCCGLAQIVPAIPDRMRACCCRCGTGLRRGAGHGSTGRTIAFATAALVLYPLAMTLPVMSIQKYGHHHEAGIVDGTAKLFASGEFFIGAVVFLCSVVLPLAKLLSLLGLSAGGWLLHHRHRALTYHLVEWTGRWGMLDVLLVAMLVAALKLGDVVSVSPGPGAIAFASVVLLSLVAGAAFDPHRLWDQEP